MAWLQARLREDPSDRSHRYWLASAHYDLEEFEVARRMFAALHEDYPTRHDFRTAALISRTQLEGLEETRAQVADELVHGHEYATLARIEAAGGDGERAMDLLSEAIRRGISGRPWLHATSLPDLGRFADDAPYTGALEQVVASWALP